MEKDDAKKKHSRHIASNVIKIVVLCALVAGLIVAYKYVSDKKDKEEEAKQQQTTTVDESVKLIKNDSGEESTTVASENSSTDSAVPKDTDAVSLNSEEIASIEVTDALYSYTLTKAGDRWILNNDEEFPLDDTTISSMVSKISDLEATRVIVKDCSDLAYYGIDEEALLHYVFEKETTASTMDVNDAGEREEAAEVESTTIEDNTAEINADADSSEAAAESTAETEGQIETQIATTTSAGSILDKIGSGELEKMTTTATAEASEENEKEPETMIVLVKLNDGSSVKVLFGTQSSVDGGYYTTINDGNTVYLTNYTTRQLFYKEEKSLIANAEIPTYEANLTKGIKVVSAEYGDVNIQYLPDEGDVTGSNVYPYKLVDHYDDYNAALDTGAISTLFENYNSLSFGDYVDYRSSALDYYGLKNPDTAVTVWYNYNLSETEAAASTDNVISETRDFTLYIGNKNEAGDSYYTRLEDSNIVYLMPAAVVEKMIKINTFALIEPYNHLVNIKLISGLNVTVNKEATDGAAKTIKYGIEQVEETTDSGSTRSTQSFTKNGAAIEEDSFRGKYQSAIGIKLVGEIKQEDKVLAENPVLELEFIDLNGEVLSDVKYCKIEGDDSRYAVDNNGHLIFYSDAASVNEIIDIYAAE
jgi:hypothetical protein